MVRESVPVTADGLDRLSMFVNVPEGPVGLTCHCMAGMGFPAPCAVNVPVAPGNTV